MSTKEKWNPKWKDLQERIAFRLFQVERHLPLLQNKITTSLNNGRWQMKVKEFEFFWKNSNSFYNNCCEVILKHSEDLAEFDFSIYPFATYLGFDNVKIGKITSKKYGEIIFICEQDEISFNQEFNVVVTRYGLNQQLGNGLRSKRLAQEHTSLTIHHYSEWNSYILSKEKAERIIYGAINHLIFSIPLYRNSDFQFGCWGERPRKDVEPPNSSEGV